MVFTPPSWVPELPFAPPDSIPIADFINSDKYRPGSLAKARNPFTCGLTGQTYTTTEVARREDWLARGIAKQLQFHHLDGTEWDRVVGLFSLNTIDYIPLTHAIHRLSGIVTPASAAYGVVELEHQLRAAGAKAVFTCVPLLETCLGAARRVGIQDDHIFILPMPGNHKKVPFKTVNSLIEEGRHLPELPPLRWIQGQGARQVAYLCFSSGTSGLPKAVMITHQNVIANIIQMHTYESVPRKALGLGSQVTLGLLPFSHIYGLVPVAHLGAYSGDECIVLPRFELAAFLKAVQNFKIQQISVVPPILVQMLSRQGECARYDISSVRYVYAGAAPLGSDTVRDLLKMNSKWKIGQIYGLTETTAVVVSTSELDILMGSSGSLLPGIKAKIIDAQGKEVTEYETPGELLAQSPAIVPGYLNNERATAETFVTHEDGRWIRTGDEVVVRKSPQGHDHFVIVDRIKELIKVKGHQVAPAELEDFVLAHPFVSDCAVVPVPDQRAGEICKAFVVRAPEALGKPDEEVARTICSHVQDHKARHKWLTGGVEFINAIPKTPSGKILRRMLRDQKKTAQEPKGARL